MRLAGRRRSLWCAPRTRGGDPDQWLIRGQVPVPVVLPVRAGVILPRRPRCGKGLRGGCSPYARG